MEEKSITENPETESKKVRAKKKSAEVETPAEEITEAAELPTDQALGQNTTEPDLGKFKSVEALMRAYRELEAEFTRRSQKLKALEESAPPAGGNTEEKRAPRNEELYREVTNNEGVRTRVLSDYLSSLRGVPLMTGGGAGVKAPSDKPKSIREAGNLALGYLRNQNK